MSHVTRENLEDLFALAPIQEGIFFHALLEPEQAPYTEQLLWDVDGDLDLVLFRRSWDALVARHPMLRTVFRQSRRQPVQMVLRRLPAAVTVADLDALPRQQQAAALASFRHQELRRPLELANGPLLRLSIFHLAPRRIKLLWTWSHIIADGWTLQLLLADLYAIYDALACGAAPPPATHPPFKQFVLWFERQDKSEALDYWRRRLAGMAAPTPLPADRPAAGGNRRSLALASAALAAAEVELLEQLARELKATLSTLVLAGWAVLLGRRGGEREVVLGLTVSGRPVELSGALRMVGPFINTLPVRALVSAGTSLRELVHDLQQQTVNLNHFSHVSLTEVQATSAVRPPRQLFETVFGYQRRSDDQVAPAATWCLRADVDATGGARSHYDLLVDATRGDGLCLGLSYVAERFDAVTVERLAAQFAELLRALPRELEARIGELEIVPAAERRQLELLGGGGGAPPFDAPAHLLFERRARQRPEALAAVCGRDALSYGALAARARRLAGRLRAAGVGRGGRVGLCGERGLGMATALVAVLEAGGAFVPLDPEQPDARLGSIFESAGLVCVVCQESLAERLDRLAGRLPARPAVVCWEEPAEAPAGSQPPAPAAGGEVAGEDLAYVLFTSGSTGVPKGAMVTHAGMLNHLRSKIELCALDERSVVVQNASHCFDISVWQLLAPLVAGGRVAIYDDDTARDPLALLRAMEKDGATVLETVPSLLEELLAALGPASGDGRLGRLALVLSTGEALPVPVARRFLARLPALPLANVYGPTECSDDITQHLLAVPLHPDLQRVPVGRPIPGLSIHVLDQGGRQAPLQALGQIAAAGAGLGRGYLGDPARTAEAFVPDPFSGRPGSRLYLTGDLGRWTAAGDLEFLGRIDSQVKIRGHRIELGELETALLRHPAVRQAAAALRPGRRGEPLLVVYWVGTEAVEAASLRHFLAAWLPSSMLPQALVRLPALPLLRSGKIDREALPDPEEGGAAGPARVPPRTGLEAGIAAVWREVLEVEEVGVHDSFFELGGHSLKTLRVRSRLQHELGMEVPLRAIFGQPTIAEQARALAPLLAGKDADHGRIPRLEGTHFALSRAQQRLWFLHQANPSGRLYNLPLALLLDGQLDGRAFRRAFRALVLRHESLRTRFIAVADQPRQEIMPAARVRLRFRDLSRLAPAAREDRLARLFLAAARRPFRLATAAVRASLIRLSEERHLLLLVLHHILADGVSGQVLVEDLAELYDRGCRQAAAALPPLPIRYADYAAWQNQRIAQGALAVEERYWLDRLAGAPPVLPLPADHRATAAAGAGPHLELVRTAEPQSGELHQLAARAGATPFMAQLAVFAAFLHCMTGEEDLLIGIPAAGRDHPQTERLIGFFVNTLVVRQPIPAGEGFRGLLDAVKRTVTEALAHGDYPFDLLVQRLNPVRDLDRTPLLQVFFASVPAGGEVLECPGLRIRSASELLGGVAQQRGIEALPGIGLALFCSAVPAGGLEWSLLFSSQLFARATARRLAGNFGSLLREATRHPEAPLSRLAMLSAAERHQLTREWNDTAGPAGLAPPIPLLFELQARRTPEAAAVVWRGERASFRELSARSDLLAGRLRQAGVGPDVVVAFCAARSIAMVVGLLAILKAGGAYLPLEPELPRQRLDFLLDDSRAPVLLADRQTFARHPDLGAGRVRLELDSAAAGVPGRAEPGLEIAPASLALVMYTSGSTGAPKGVAIAHQALANLFAWLRQTLTAGERERIFAAAALSFDSSVFELFAPLCWGGTMVLADSLLELAAVAREQRVTMVTAVPSIMTEVLARDGLPASLRAVGMGGETLSRGLVRQLYRHRQLRRVMNVYGPTEVTLFATAALVARRDRGEPPLGRPIANAEVLVLGRDGQQVPVGVVGELHVAGAGLARGYLGRPALTAERFTPHPWSELPGMRLYRTGDHARWRPDGTLEFCGRRDFQVKFRGVRIELAEIEQALCGHAGVREAVVVVRQLGQAGDSLVAYLVAGRQGAPTRVELRAFLAARLPRSLVPNAFVWLEDLPRLTASGKVDRRRLPAPPAPAAAAPAGDFIPPRDALELAVSEILEEHLGLPVVGARDNFFDLGGHSLQALSLLSRLRGRFAVDVPLRAFFSNPTVEGIGLIVRESLAARERPPAGGLIPLRATASRLPPLLLVHPQGGSVFCYHALARALAVERTVYGFQAPGLEEGEEPLASIEQIAAHGCALLRQAQPDGPYHLAGWSFGGPVAFEMARQLESGGERVAFLGILDTVLSADGMPREQDLSYAGLARAFFGTPPEDLAGGDEEQGLRRFLAAAHHAGALPPDIDERTLRRLVSVLRANILAVAGYRPSGKVRADVALFRARSASYVADAGAWMQWTEGRLEVVEVDGTHHTLVFPPAVTGLAQAIDRMLGGAPAAAA